MTYVKDQAVGSCIKYSFQGNCQLDNAQIGGQVASGLRNIGDEKFPNFLAQLILLGRSQILQITVTLDSL